MTHKNAMFPKLNRHSYSFYDWLSCYWFDFQPLGTKRNWRKKLSKQKQGNPSNVVPSIPHWIHWVNGTEDGRHLQLNAVHEIFSSMFLPKSPGLNAKDIRTKSGVKNGEWQTVRWHRGEQIQWTGTHSSSSQSSLWSCCRCHRHAVIVDNKSSGNKEK